jgi:hypothetical protein
MTRSRTKQAPPEPPATVLFASLIGTTIEFFDFYIYATAAVLVFPKLFFPAGGPGRRRAAIASRPSPSPSSRVRSARPCSATSATASAARPRWWRRC